MADDLQGHRDAAHTAILHCLAVALRGIHLNGELLPAMRALHFCRNKAIHEENVTPWLNCATSVNVIFRSRHSLDIHRQGISR